MKKKPAKKLPRLPERDVLGTWKLAGVNVQVVVDWTKIGGSFYFAPDAKGPPRIRVGCDHGWPDVVAVLMHEALELVLTLAGQRFKSCQGWGHNHGDYIFHLDHNQFCQAVDKLADFCTVVMPVLAHAYSTRKRELKRRKLPALGA